MDTNIAVLRPVGPAVAEPDWTKWFSDPGEVAAAAEVWRTATGEMAEAQTLAAANGRAIQRYVFACIMFGKAAAIVGKEGPVLKAKRTGAAAHSAWWTAVRDADTMAAQAEERLGLSPRSRGRVGQARQRRLRPSSPADAYLKPRA